MRFKEVIEFWFKSHNFNKLTVPEFDKLVVDRLCLLIKEEGKPMKGVMGAFEFLKTNNFKIGLATSSNIGLMETVLETLQIGHYFHALCSAQHLTHGKPHPQVFINCAEELGVHSSHCIVIEDSVNGIIAGKAAHMKVIAIPEEEHRHNPKFSIADYKLESLLELIK
jgi:sugar-phosphatase